MKKLADRRWAVGVFKNMNARFAVDDQDRFRFRYYRIFKIITVQMHAIKLRMVPGVCHDSAVFFTFWYYGKKMFGVTFYWATSDLFFNVQLNQNNG